MNVFKYLYTVNYSNLLNIPIRCSKVLKNCKYLFSQPANRSQPSTPSVHLSIRPPSPTPPAKSHNGKIRILYLVQWATNEAKPQSAKHQNNHQQIITRSWYTDTTQQNYLNWKVKQTAGQTWSNLDTICQWPSSVKDQGQVSGFRINDQGQVSRSDLYPILHRILGHNLQKAAAVWKCCLAAYLTLFKYENAYLTSFKYENAYLTFFCPGLCLYHPSTEAHPHQPIWIFHKKLTVKVHLRN